MFRGFIERGFPHPFVSSHLNKTQWENGYLINDFIFLLEWILDWKNFYLFYSFFYFLNWRNLFLLKSN